MANHGELWQQLGRHHNYSDLIVGQVAPSPAPNPAVVSIPEVGNVTLATLDQIRASRTQVAAEFQTLTQEASSLESQAEQKFADAGAIMVPRQSEANLPTALAPETEKARQLVAQIASLDVQLQELSQRPHSGLGAVLAKARDWNEGRKRQGNRDTMSKDLRELLVSIGRGGAQTPIAEAGTLVAEALETETKAAATRNSATDKSAQVVAYDSEIALRAASQKQMGFDALYTVAYLATYGPPAIESPLELKRGEHAYLSVPATLSRNQTRTHYVGGSQGFSFPIGHTGIRYRVGSFHGQPVSQQVLTKIDQGSLVITSHRIAFVGRLKSVVIQLDKVVHVEIYSDALAVFHEKHENPEFFLVQAPKQVVFYINWALNQVRA